MLNYEIDSAIVLPLVPKGTELDAWNGKTFVSMVGFLFLNTRVMGLAIPFHQNFEEINLRFYKAEDGWRRGVVFLKEIVPRTAIALTARWLYNENYVALNVIVQSRASGGNIETVKYYWKFRNQTHSIEPRHCGERVILSRDPKKSSLCSIIGATRRKKTVAPSSIRSSTRDGEFGWLKVAG